MNNKFILENILTGEKSNFKTMRNISDFLCIDYHKARGLYIYNTKGKKQLHNITKSYLKSIK